MGWQKALEYMHKCLMLKLILLNFLPEGLPETFSYIHKKLCIPLNERVTSITETIPLKVVIIQSFTCLQKGIDWEHG